MAHRLLSTSCCCCFSRRCGAWASLASKQPERCRRRSRLRRRKARRPVPLRPQAAPRRPLPAVRARHRPAGRPRSLRKLRRGRCGAIAKVRGECLLRLKPPDAVLATTQWIIQRPRSRMASASIPCGAPQKYLGFASVGRSSSIRSMHIRSAPANPSKLGSSTLASAVISSHSLSEPLGRYLGRRQYLGRREYLGRRDLGRRQDLGPRIGANWREFAVTPDFCYTPVR